MKKICVLPMLVALTIFGSCQKQETEAERQAEVDRQVQQRLDAEHQTQQKDELAKRESDLEAREKALNEKQVATPSAPAEEDSEPARIQTRREAADQDNGPAASY